MKKGGDPQHERTRIETILREYHSKAVDLRQKYRLTIDVKLLQAIEIILPVHRFNLVIKRRKAERRVPLDWNPIDKRLEPPPCEYSFASEPGRMVCDDASHIVSLPGFAPCMDCGREFCRLCNLKSCPKCRHPLIQEIMI